MIGRTIVSLIGIAGIALATGCQSTERTVTSNAVERARLEPRGPVYVAIPSDAFFKNNVMIDSGTNTASVVVKAFSRYVKPVYLGRRMETVPEAMSTARRAKCTYLVYPTVLRWEERTTEYSGIRDQVEVKIEVLSVDTADLLHATVISGKGKWLTSGGETPKDILLEPLTKYAATVFQVIETPTAIRGLR